jgi:hypothetical protein
MHLTSSGLRVHLALSWESIKQIGGTQRAKLDRPRRTKNDVLTDDGGFLAHRGAGTRFDNPILTILTQRFGVLGFLEPRYIWWSLRHIKHCWSGVAQRVRSDMGWQPGNKTCHLVVQVENIMR